MDIGTLKSHLEYHPDGHFIWKKLPKHNGRAVLGERAGWTGHTYDQVRFMGKVHSVHRLVFFYHNGYFPRMVDHINGDKRDNRIENLRACTAAQNSQNRKQRIDNTSGEIGVVRDGNRWQVCVTANNRVYWGGRFDDKQEAIKRARELRQEHQGEFFCTR